ncbi:MAG: 30S ribosome-binding factor RbfA [Nitrospinae bacterium]|nr:30S ribosome-binding factor RbfA [Nitrospinota bacterium]
MFSFKRSARMRELIQAEVAAIIREELKDPRIGFVTVMHVELADNLRHADIYISPMGTDGQKKSTFKAIRTAAPFIRRLLGERIKIKFIPAITIKWDHSGEHADTVNRLLREMEAERAEPGDKPPHGE